MRTADVFIAIDEERAFHAQTWENLYREESLPVRSELDRPVEEWLILMLNRLHSAVSAATDRGEVKEALTDIKQLAALAVDCMLANGFVDRAKGLFMRGDMTDVRRAVVFEKTFRDQADGAKTYSIYGYLCLLYAHLHLALLNWQDSEKTSLKSVRDIAAVCLKCLETHT